MTNASIAFRLPPARAGRSARGLGLILAVLTLLGLAGALSAGPGRGEAIVIIGMAAIYLLPSLLLVLLSGAIQRHRRGPTIAALVLTTLIASVLSLGLLLQAVTVSRTAQPLGLRLIPLVIEGMIAARAIVVGVYCILSLRFPDVGESPRGFEPILDVTPVPAPDAPEARS